MEGGSDPTHCRGDRGNKGIGFEICRQLATQSVNVVLTARNRLRGERAAAALQSRT